MFERLIAEDIPHIGHQLGVTSIYSLKTSCGVLCEAGYELEIFTFEVECSVFFLTNTWA